MTADGAADASSRPLILRGVALGKLSTVSLRTLRTLPGEFARAFSWRDDAVTLSLPDDNTVAGRQLAALVEALAVRNVLPPLRGEMLDIVTPTGLPMGLTLERSAFRFFGFVTRCVAAVAVTPAGHVWLGRRSPQKRINPGLFDTLARGLVSARETPSEALRRETLEEAGLTEPAVRFAPDPRVNFSERAVPEGMLREITYTYRAQTATGVTPNNRDGEVTSFRAVTRDELRQLAFEKQLTLDTEAALRQLNFL